MLANGRQADLADVAAGQPVLEQGPDRIAVEQPLVGLAQVEMGVERDQADPLERKAEAMDGGPRHRIVAADQQGEPMCLDAGLHRVADRREAVGRHHAPDRDVARVA